MKNAIIKKNKPLGFQWETSNPFIFCVHHEDFFPKGNGKLGPASSLLVDRNIGQDFTIKDGFRMYHGHRIPGFPEHTIIMMPMSFKNMAHAPSRGSKSIFSTDSLRFPAPQHSVKKTGKDKKS